MGEVSRGVREFPGVSTPFEQVFGIGSVPVRRGPGYPHRTDRSANCPTRPIPSLARTSPRAAPRPRIDGLGGMAAAAGTASDREKALQTALTQIERQCGKGSVMRLGEKGRAPIDVIPTGSIALDVALGIGGLPRGRVVEIYGPESSGK